MRNILKFKLSLLFFSLIILLFLFLWKKNFYINPEIVKWRQLTGHDFNGFVKPFTTFDAGVYSDIYLEYDSSERKYNAYAGLDSRRSYLKSQYKDHSAILKHEQYHFNIAEVFARKMNKYIQEKHPEDPTKMLRKFRNEHNTLQDKYDNESNHSTITHMQHWWEYQIDSLLIEYSSTPVSTIDYYSGAKVFFADAPEQKTTLSNNMAMRIYNLDKYEVEFTLRIMSVGYEMSYHNMKDYFLQLTAVDSLKIHEHNIYDREDHLEGVFTAFDSLNNQTSQIKVILKKPYLYFVAATFPESHKKEDGYKKICNSFINSFEIVDVSDYWISQAAKEDSLSITFAKEKQDKNDDQEGDCLVFRGNSTHSFLGQTVFTDDGNLIVPYVPIDAPDSAIHEYIININEEILIKKPDGNEVFIQIPNKFITQNNYDVFYGYTLKKDSTEVCRQLYYQGIQFTMN